MIRLARVPVNRSGGSLTAVILIGMLREISAGPPLPVVLASMVVINKVSLPIALVVGW